MWLYLQQNYSWHVCQPVQQTEPSLLLWKGITKKRKDFQPKILNSVVFTKVEKTKSLGILAR